MNPLHIARNLRDDYLLLLRTTFAPRQQELRDAFLHEIERDGFLTREPFISLAQPYQHAGPLTMLTGETRRRFEGIADRPFAHQAAACARIVDGKPTVVATGTGSGKTEAFLLPILDHCLRHKGEPGPKALLIYPMNALANDQLRRIRQRLAGSGVSFGRYTGETQLMGSRLADISDEERWTRAEFRSSPPDLILTNYQMLEYMLLRGDGRDIFKNHRIRFIVLDEVHTYHGALGTDVACLLRRLRSALSTSRPEDPAPLFIGTSATLHAGIEGGDPRDGIAAFFTRLTDQKTGPEAVIVEESDLPEQPSGLIWPPAPDVPREVLDAFDPTDEQTARRLARLLTGAREDDGANLATLWARTPLPYVLTQWLREPRSVEEIADLLAQQPGRQGVDREQLLREIEAALLVGPCLAEEHPLRLRPRVHRFLRGLVPFWRCTNPECGKLLGEGIVACDVCGAKSLPLALCRTCGWDFLMARSGGQTLDGELMLPWEERSSSDLTVFLYDRPKTRPELGDKEDTDEFEGGDTGDVGEEEAAAEATTASPERTETADHDDHVAYLCPDCLCLSSRAGKRSCGCRDDRPVRPVLAYRHRGTQCPICEDTYGRYDILTPVSLGNSSALSHVSRALISDLPEDRRKLLVFCDSRQDAAHQARFIQNVEDYLQLRRGVYRLLARDGEQHDYAWLVNGLYHDRVEGGVLPRRWSRDAQDREKARIEGELLTEFAIFTKVRAGLDRLGLVRVRYAGLDEQLRQSDFGDLCHEHGLDRAEAGRAVAALLDYMRRRRALTHEALQQRLRRGDRLSDRYGLTPGQQVGYPIAFVAPGLKSVRARSYSLVPLWSRGRGAAAQRLWKQLAGQEATEHSLEAVTQWLLTQELLAEVEVGSDAEHGQGLQVNLDRLLVEVAHSYTRCTVCGRIAPNEPPDGVCYRVGCDGHFEQCAGPLGERNLEALNIATDYAPTLRPAEHSAAIGDEQRQKIEDGFMAVPPRYNVLACTPTLELGVNIGDLEAVAMRNIPPNPAHYAQRAGRTGRETRMGVVAGFARQRPHDGYFFDHPEEVISGSIPPPRFNLQNLEAVTRHAHSLALEEARIDFPSNLEAFIDDEGNLNESKVQELTRTIRDGCAAARGRALAVFREVLTEESRVDRILESLPRDVESALWRRAAFIADAVQRMRQISHKVGKTEAEKRAAAGSEELAVRLRTDHRYAYLPRLLAEEGILPGYAFPGDPGSLSLGYDPEPVFAGRLQAQREYAPGQVVYLRSQRWRVRGVALHRPGVTRTRGRSEFEFTECPACGLANPAHGHNTCRRCRAELSGSTARAWDVGAFSASVEEKDAQTEEERLIGKFDVRPHPQRDVPGQGYGLGPWQFSLRRQETIWWINHGRFGSDGNAQAEPFQLCRTCGEMIRVQHGATVQTSTTKSRRRPKKDPEANRDPHLERCGGQVERLCLGHELRADTLRLFVPGLVGLGSEGVDWAVSLGYAILQGAIRVFDLDEDDLEPLVLTSRHDNAEGAAEILWIDRVTGGSGILESLVTHFPKVAAAAVQHLDGHDCSRSCYRCLRSYTNQGLHRRLNWRLVFPQLQAAAQEAVEPLEQDPAGPPSTEGPEWEEARAEGCESPQELRLLRAIRASGLPEPVKQHEVRADQGVLITRADFAYLEQRLLIYVDGMEFHSTLSQRIHDTRQTNELQGMGYRVLRFLGPEVHRNAEQCVEQVRGMIG